MEPRTESLMTFEARVHALAQRRKGDVFFNSGPDKARVVARHLFDAANSSIAIYSGGLDENIYSEQMFDSLLEGGLEPDAVRVIISEPEGAGRNDELLAHLTFVGIEVRHHADVGAHMIVVDNDCYRLEHDHDGKRAAFAFGNNLKDGTNLPKRLLSIFDQMWERATPPAATTA